MQNPGFPRQGDLPVVSTLRFDEPRDPRQQTSIIQWIRAALADYGCFVLRVEGAGSSLDAATRQWRRFYALPEAIKRACQAQGDDSAGWSRLRDEPVYMSHMRESEHADGRCKEQFGCRANTDHDLWPREQACPGFRSDVSACADRIGDAARGLMTCFEELLEQEPGFLRHEPGFLTLTSYPAELPVTHDRVDAEKRTEVGLSEHSDAVVFTMLCQTAAALQLKVGEDWLSVPMLAEDCILVIPGDWMEIFSNGVIPATRHRVLDLPKDREAIVFFQNVAPMRVAPLDRFVPGGDKASYPSVSSDIPYTEGAAGVPRWQTHAKIEPDS